MLDNELIIKYKRAIGVEDNIYVIIVDSKLNDEYYETTISSALRIFLRSLKIDYSKFIKIDSICRGDYYTDTYWVYT
jgi:hypothetical protein